MKEIDQKEYSNYVLNGLLKRFPYFIDYYKFTNDIFTIEYPSAKGLLKLWITTQDLEITIGFDNKDGNCDWHIHLSQYEAILPEDELEKTIKIVNSILIGEAIITFNSRLGYYLSDDQENEMKNKLADEIIEFKEWNEL